MLKKIKKILFLGMLSSVLFLATSLGSVYAAVNLKLAHVYESAHPYHVDALWAAKQIKKKTSGRVSLKVFPSSSLGNEQAINEGLNIGSVDIILTGASFLEQFYGPISISDYPFMLRDYKHWKKYRGSKLFKELSAGFKNKTGNEIVAISYYGQRHVTSNKPIRKPSDMKNLKIRVPNAPLYFMFPKSVGASPTPMAFSEVYLALKQGVVDAQENPLPTIKFKKFYEVQSYINLTGHNTISTMTVMSKLTKNKLSSKDYKIVKKILATAASRSSDTIDGLERELGSFFKKQGVTMVKVDKKAFSKAVAPALSDPNLPFTKKQMERIKSL